MCRSNAGDVRGRTEEQSTFARYRDRRCRERSLVPSTDGRTTAGRYYNTESVAIGSGSGGRMTARVRDHARPGIWDGRYLGSVRVVCESVRTVSERMLQATLGHLPHAQTIRSSVQSLGHVVLQGRVGGRAQIACTRSTAGVGCCRRHEETSTGAGRTSED